MRLLHSETNRAIIRLWESSGAGAASRTPRACPSRLRPTASFLNLSAGDYASGAAGAGNVMFGGELLGPLLPQA